jgi:hypothetical protein
MDGATRRQVTIDLLKVSCGITDVDCSPEIMTRLKQEIPWCNHHDDGFFQDCYNAMLVVMSHDKDGTNPYAATVRRHLARCGRSGNKHSSPAPVLGGHAKVRLKLI